MRKLANVQLLQGYLCAQFPRFFLPNLKNVLFCFKKSDLCWQPLQIFLALLKTAVTFLLKWDVFGSVFGFCLLIKPEVELEHGNVSCNYKQSF